MEQQHQGASIMEGSRMAGSPRTGLGLQGQGESSPAWQIRAAQGSWGHTEGLRPGRWIQRRRKAQLEKQGKERRKVLPLGLRFPHNPKANCFLIPRLGHWAALQRGQHSACHSWFLWLLMYVPPVAVAAAEAAGSLLLLGNMVMPDGKVPGEKSWCIGQCREHSWLPILENMAWFMSARDSLVIFQPEQKSHCAECKRKGRCLGMGWQGNGGQSGQSGIANGAAGSLVSAEGH